MVHVIPELPYFSILASFIMIIAGTARARKIQLYQRVTRTCKPISIKDVVFRTSFGLGPEKTENQGPNRERKAGRWGKSMVLRGALERCETGANPLETKGKRKPVTPENGPRETGLSFLNGGGGDHQTQTVKC